MKSMVGKLAAITMGPLMALALYGGFASAGSVQTCSVSSQDAFFYKSNLTIVKGKGVGNDTLIFTGRLVNEDPTVECFQGLDLTNGCSGANEKGDDFITGGAGNLSFVLNDNTACNLSPPANFFFFTLPSGFTKVNNDLATFSGTASGQINANPVTVTVNAKVWRVGSSSGSPNFNYTNATCGTFGFWIQVTNVDLQSIPSLVANPLTWSMNFGADVGGTQSYGCFPTIDATICSAGGVKGDGDDDDKGCPCASGGGGDNPLKGSGDDEGCGDDLHSPKASQHRN
jgi:hypothetical protein